MIIGTSEMCSNMDRACVEKLGLPLIVLMENAALKVLNHMDMEFYKNYVIVCGCGNNGGDGLALARHLTVQGKAVEIFMVNTGGSMSDCCKINYTVLKNMGVRINSIDNECEAEGLKAALINSEVTVDALFGTGLNKDVTGVYSKVIDLINNHSRRTVAIDIPSGLQGDRGTVLGNVVRAHKTVCFEVFKRGFLNYDSEKYTGEVVVESIGIPAFIIDEFHKNEYMLCKEELLKHIKPRERYSHKGSFGKALIIAGSTGFTGAAYLSTQAAVRSGAGLVTLACSEAIQPLLSSKLAEAMTIGYEEEKNFDRAIESSNAIAIGPGMGNSEGTLNKVKKVIKTANCTIIIDADGINVLRDNLDILREKNNEVIITPHLGEMSRITGLSIDYIRENRVDIAKKFALENSVIVLLKGYQTVITDGKTTYINTTGNSSMASGGMGDCLTGIITALAAQGIPAFSSAFCGAFLHGYAGDKLAESMYTVNASHLIEKIPFIFKEIQK